MSHAHGGGEAGEPNLIPLLDLVFQLIMFFMITVNFVRTDQFNEEVQLPVAQAAVPMDRAADNWVFLNMNQDGKLIVSSGEDLSTPGKIKVFVERQKRVLEREAAERGHKGELKVVIVLRAHRDARYKDVWEALDSCNKAGYQRWQLRVLYQGKAS
jgi:biopolymer transport protein ExbD